MVDQARLAERIRHVEQARVFLASLGPQHPAVTFAPVAEAFGVDRPADGREMGAEAAQRRREVAA